MLSSLSSDLGIIVTSTLTGGIIVLAMSSLGLQPQNLDLIVDCTKAFVIVAQYQAWHRIFQRLF